MANAGTRDPHQNFRALRLRDRAVMFFNRLVKIGDTITFHFFSPYSFGFYLLSLGAIIQASGTRRR
jgi:hypothetical protein